MMLLIEGTFCLKHKQQTLCWMAKSVSNRNHFVVFKSMYIYLKLKVENQTNKKNRILCIIKKKKQVSIKNTFYFEEYINNVSSSFRYINLIPRKKKKIMAVNIQDIYRTRTQVVQSTAQTHRTTESEKELENFTTKKRARV